MASLIYNLIYMFTIYTYIHLILGYNMITITKKNYNPSPPSFYVGTKQDTIMSLSTTHISLHPKQQNNTRNDIKHLTTTTKTIVIIREKKEQSLFSFKKMTNKLFLFHLVFIIHSISFLASSNGCRFVKKRRISLPRKLLNWS